jgi:hypothetical protein
MPRRPGAAARPSSPDSPPVAGAEDRVARVMPRPAARADDPQAIGEVPVLNREVAGAAGLLRVAGDHLGAEPSGALRRRGGAR